METFSPAQKKELKVLIAFIRLYCRSKHTGHEEVHLPDDMARLAGTGLRLCPDCGRLLAYALERRRKCPLDPKPTCKHCHIQCYNKEFRAKMQEVMGYSGRKMIMRGRLDYLWHYFF